MVDNANNNMADIDPRMTSGAVSIYGADASADEFPVLKAFQQYIDAEQAKSRKRMMLLCIFFSFLMLVTIGVFVALLIASSSRNQSLNDRLVDYLMKDRDRNPVPAQQTQENNDLRSLSEKFESLQKTLAEDQNRAKKAAEEAEMEKCSTVEALEIERLKALLAAEKEKSAAENERRRQAELEEYRRKHYPELYGLKPAKSPSASSKTSRRNVLSEEEEAADREIESILNSTKAIDYFDEAEDEETPTKRPAVSKRKTEKKDAVPSKDDVEIPDGVRDSSGNTWGIPEE